MNTTKKGDDLENKVFELFRDDIQNDRFWAKKECCKIYQKKAYYSESRKKNITFDIAIEIYLPGEDDFSSLVLIECKHYKNKVPPGSVEKFLSQAHQVSGGNVKAIVVSNNAFQEGAFNFAQSQRIGLLRYYDRSNLEWILHRSPSSIVNTNYALSEWSGAYNGLHKSKYESRYFDFLGYVNNLYTNSLRLFVGALLKEELEQTEIERISVVETVQARSNSIVKFREESEIESLCEEILTNIQYSFGEVPLSDICSMLHDQHGLSVVETNELPEGVLGTISFEPLKIEILKDQENEARKKFTLAHELGHFILGHSEYMSGEKCVESSLDLEGMNDVGLKDVMRMEWQANQFASHLLLPTKQFVHTFKSIAIRNGLSDRGFGFLYLDHQKCNQDAYYSVTSPLMNLYKVSRKAIKIRLKKLGYINESSSI